MLAQKSAARAARAHVAPVNLAMLATAIADRTRKGTWENAFQASVPVDSNPQ